ncbi:MAG: UPF0754 membrane protein [Pirellulaceae bacterium]|nr:MAG: UPF0754 membrane protein [Pirellulaceae bacterium]
MGTPHPWADLRRWSTWNRITFAVSVALMGVFLIGSPILALFGYEWTDWARQWFWPMALAAVVGYMTNFVAVEMLFKPYDRTEWHWLRGITLGLWRQGVVPSRKSEIAQAVGEQFSRHLLTPERISEQIVDVARRLLDSPDLRRQIRQVLGPVIRKQLPALINKLTPEVMSLLRKAGKSALQKEFMVSFIEDVLQPWLADRATRKALVDVIVDFLQAHAPTLVRELQRAVQAYARTSFWRRLALSLAEVIGFIDWQEVRTKLYDYVDSAETRRKLYDWLGNVAGSIAETVATDERLVDALESLKVRSQDVLVERVEEFLHEQLPEVGQRLVDSPDFWNWLANQALPESKTDILAWLERERGGVFLAREFNVAGAVATAVNELPVSHVHNLVNQVSANELGAIQVLGFILGGVAGTVMAALLFYHGLANAAVVLR